MNSDIKTKWTAALLSGDYPQTKEVLRDSCGFCCLGVLTDLYIRENKGLIWENSFLVKDEETKQSWNSYLPRKVMEWSGLVEINLTMKLAAMNDSGKSFAEIAKFIERKV